MKWQKLFKCKQKNNDSLLLRMLGWEEFCDCGLEAPYLHAHADKITPRIWDEESSIKCICDKQVSLSHAVFGRILFGPWREVKYYTCWHCKIEFRKDFDLIFKSHATYIMLSPIAEEKKTNAA